VEAWSQDTHQKATRSAAILKAEGITRIVLVTHAWHMPRAKLVFERAGMTIIPAPPIVSYRHLDYRFTTVFPLFWRFGTPQDRQTWLLPLAFRGRSDGGGHLVVFPLLWHFSGKKWHTTVVANSWYHRHEHGYSGAFLPLVYFGADRKEGVSYTTVLPFFHRSTEDHGRHTFLLTPIGIHENDRDAATSYTWILNYYRRRDPEREIDTFVPLYLRWRNIGSGSTVQAITPLVWLHSGLDGGTMVLFPAIYIMQLYRKEANPAFWHLVLLAMIVVGLAPGIRDMVRMVLYV